MAGVTFTHMQKNIVFFSIIYDVGEHPNSHSDGGSCRHSHCVPLHRGLQLGCCGRRHLHPPGWRGLCHNGLLSSPTSDG